MNILESNTIKKIALTISMLVSLLTYASPAHAGGCVMEYVTYPKMLVSQYMGNMIRDRIIEIEKKMNAKGQKLNVVLVARSGENMEDFKIIEPNPQIPLTDYVYQLADLAEKSAFDHMTEPGKNNPIVPEEYVTNQKLQYSHFGFYVRTHPDDPKGRPWSYIIHLLAECDSKSKRYGESSIFNQTLDRFYWDTKVLEQQKGANKTQLVVPTPAMQKSIYETIKNIDVSVEGLHERKYNVAATPFSFQNRKDHRKNPEGYRFQLTDQNSAQWPLEVIAAATKPLNEIKDRKDAQKRLMETNYRPSLLIPKGLKNNFACTLNKFSVLGKNLWDATNLVNCEDQSFRKQNFLQIITVDSVINYMAYNGWLSEDVDQKGRYAIYDLEGDKKTIKTIGDAATIIDEKIKKIFPNDVPPKDGVVDGKH